MDKGIRPFVNAKFLELLPTRVNDRLGNRNFRASVITSAMESFGIPLHSAATAYNNAFINAKELAKTNAELATALEGLGRPEDKKGGRKKKVQPAEAPAVTAAPIPEEGNAASQVLESNILGNSDAHDEDDAADETPPADTAPADTAPKVRVVQKNGKGTAQEFDTMEAAQAYIEANSGQFKPRLVIAE